MLAPPARASLRAHDSRREEPRPVSALIIAPACRGRALPDPLDNLGNANLTWVHSNNGASTEVLFAHQ
jgi:hypothetical protein